MSVGSAGNWPPSGQYLPENHSKSMISLPEVSPSIPNGRFYPPTDEMFPVLSSDIKEREDHSPPDDSPISKPSIKHPGGGLNYVW